MTVHCLPILYTRDDMTYSKGIVEQTIPTIRPYVAGQPLKISTADRSHRALAQLFEGNASTFGSATQWKFIIKSNQPTLESGDLNGSFRHRRILKEINLSSRVC